MYQAVAKSTSRSWPEVQDAFLRAMEGFDANVVSGVANQGDWQNGKGDFFNDLLALLLERGSGVDLPPSRRGVPGLIFPRHSLDVTFPASGLPAFLVEAKAVGNPKHSRNPAQKNPLGRPGSADLDKRIKEAGFKTIDLKAEYGRRAVALGESAEGIGGDLTAWLRRVKPASDLFIAARVVDDADRVRVESQAHQAAQVFDAVGVVCFEPKSPATPTKYEIAPVKDSAIQLERVLHRGTLALKEIVAAGA